MNDRICSLICACLLLMIASCSKEYENPLDPDVPFVKPANLLVAETGMNQIKVSWNYTSTFEDGFRLVISGPLEKTIELGKKTFEYSFEGIVPGDYSIELFAYTNDRTSEKATCIYTMTSDVPTSEPFIFHEIDSYVIRLSFDYTTKDAKLKVYENGIVWSDSKNNPTIEDHFILQKDNEILMDGLTPVTSYFIRPYWKCNNGIHYGVVTEVKTDRYSNERLTFDIERLSEDLSIHFNLSGENIWVDWGDGSEVEDMKNIQGEVGHTYRSPDKRKVVIYGASIDVFGISSYPYDSEDNFLIKARIEAIDLSKALSINDLSLTSQRHLNTLDLSKNVRLEYLHIWECDLEQLDISNNKELFYLTVSMTGITTLDVSNQTMFEHIQLAYNRFSTEALNKFFTQLSPPIWEDGENALYMGGNPGSAFCNPKIAEDKGWYVDVADFLNE